MDVCCVLNYLIVSCRYQKLYHRTCKHEDTSLHNQLSLLFQLPLAVLTNLGWRLWPFIIFHDSLGLFGKSGDCSAPSGVSGITWGHLEAQQAALSGGSLPGLECASLQLGDQLGCLPEPLGSPPSTLPAWPGPSQYGAWFQEGMQSAFKNWGCGPCKPPWWLFSWRGSVGYPCQDLELRRMRCGIALLCLTCLRSVL